MPFSAGTYTKARDFTTDKATGVNPSAANFDEVIDDISTALSSTFLRDGTVTMTGAFDAGSQKIKTTGNLEIATNKFVVTGATGALALAGDLAVATDKFTVASATGNTVVAGTLGVTSDVAVNTNKFTVAASTGNTLAAGTLSCTSDFAVNTTKFTVAASTGNTVVAGTLAHANAYFCLRPTANFNWISVTSATSGVTYVISNVQNNAGYTSGGVGVTMSSTTGASGDCYFTVTSAGLYEINAVVAGVAQAESATNVNISLVKGGSVSSRVLTGHTVLAMGNTQHNATVAVPFAVPLSVIVSLSANDVLRLAYSKLTITSDKTTVYTPNITIKMISSV